MLEDLSTNMPLSQDPMRFYRAKRDMERPRVSDKYSILGFISSGTYGRVYKAQSKGGDARIHAIKKFKPDKEGDVITYTGISQSAIREIAVSVCFEHSGHPGLGCWLYPCSEIPSRLFLKVMTQAIAHELTRRS